MKENRTWEDMELLFEKIQFAKDIESKLVDEGRTEEADEIALYSDCYYPWDVVKEILEDKEGVVRKTVPPIAGKKPDYYFRDVHNEEVTKGGKLVSYVFTSVDQDESFNIITDMMKVLKEKGFEFGKEKVMATNVKQITLDIAAPVDWDGEKFFRELLEKHGLNVLGSNQEDLTESYKESCGFGKNIEEFGLKESVAEKELSVNTPLGDIAVSVKTDSEYPGVYVDLKGENVNDVFRVGETSLAMIEFDPIKEKVQAVVYGDGSKEEPTHILEYVNIEKDIHKDAMSRKKVEEQVYGWLDRTTDALDVESADYKKAESLIKDLCACEFPELYDGVFGNSGMDLIFKDPEGGFKVFYYNPDSNVGGQIVEGQFEESDIPRLLADKETTEVIANYTQYLSDINSIHFFDTIFELLDLKEKGCFLGVDAGEVCRNYLKSKDVSKKSLDEKMDEARGKSDLSSGNVKKERDGMEI